MSTYYRSLTELYSTDLFDGRLEALGVREDVIEDATEKSRLLTDGCDYLWVPVADGLVGDFTVYTRDAPDKILNAISEAFNVHIVSEYEPQFWGFDTQEEMDAHDCKIVVTLTPED